MNRYVVLYVSTVFLVAGCGGATRKGTMASSDAALSFAMSTPVPSREIVSKSECAATAETRDSSATQRPVSGDRAAW
jgi:hypothetical protein